MNQIFTIVQMSVRLVEKKQTCTVSSAARATVSDVALSDIVTQSGGVKQTAQCMTGILVKQFCLTAFRDWQLEIIQAVLAIKNTHGAAAHRFRQKLVFPVPSSGYQEDDSGPCIALKLWQR